jgi:hypothetical protein
MQIRSRLTMVLMLGVLTLMGPVAYGQTDPVSAPSFLNAPRCWGWHGDRHCPIEE